MQAVEQPHPQIRKRNRTDNLTSELRQLLPGKRALRCVGIMSQRAAEGLELLLQPVEALQGNDQFLVRTPIASDEIGHLRDGIFQMPDIVEKQRRENLQQTVQLGREDAMRRSVDSRRILLELLRGIAIH